MTPSPFPTSLVCKDVPLLTKLSQLSRLHDGAGLKPWVTMIPLTAWLLIPVHPSPGPWHVTLRGGRGGGGGVGVGGSQNVLSSEPGRCSTIEGTSQARPKISSEPSSEARLGFSFYFTFSGSKLQFTRIDEYLTKALSCLGVGGVYRTLCVEGSMMKLKWNRAK